MISLQLPPEKTFAEFFAGIGLMRMGLEAEGWRIAYANDICPDKFEMYRANFDDSDDLIEDAMVTLNAHWVNQ